MYNMAEELRAITKRAIEEKQEQMERIYTDAWQEATPVLVKILAKAREAAERGQYTIRIAGIRVDIDKLSENALKMLEQELKEKGFKVKIGIETHFDCSLTDIIESIPRHDIVAYDRCMERIDSHTKRFVSHITLSW